MAQDKDKIINSIVENMAEAIAGQGVSVIKGGNNGPYYDTETNVRNMAHWCVVFSEYFLNTSKDKYRQLAEQLADAICDSEEFNGKGVYRCRISDKKDEVNGVIGAAWIIEGLIYAYKATGNGDYLDRARLLFMSVPFNEKLGIWNRINTKNEKLSVDVTFNHQLWFAAAGAMVNSVSPSADIERRLDVFINKLPRNCSIKRSGRIAHFTANDQNGIVSIFGRIYRDMVSDINEVISRPSMRYKEAGYDTFNLYGFAILSDYYGKDIEFLSKAKFINAIKYLSSKEYIDDILAPDKNMDVTHVSTKLSVPFNVFSFAYNSPAFELPRIVRCFGDGAVELKQLCDSFMEKQLAYTYDEDKKQLCKNTDDPATLTARVYEYIAGNKEYFEGIIK